MSNVDMLLGAEKRHRDDASRYIDTNLVRQRQINEAVFAFADPFFGTHPDGLVIDACAGPEGSYLATARRRLRWVGNDISTRFASVLRNTGASVVLSDFANAPYKSESASAVAFIYALENINRPAKAIDEAARILKPGGIAMYCEPGPCWFTASIIAGHISGRNPKAVAEFFSGKEYTQKEFVEFYVQNSLGVELNVFEADVLVSANPAKSREVRKHTYSALMRRYFENIDRSLQRNDLGIMRVGILAAVNVGSNWQVSGVFEVDTPNRWMAELWQARRMQGVLSGELSPIAKSSPQKNICPVIIAQKAS